MQLIPFVFVGPFSIAEASVFTEKGAVNEQLSKSCKLYVNSSKLFNLLVVTL